MFIVRDGGVEGICLYLYGFEWRFELDWRNFVGFFGVFREEVWVRMEESMFIFRFLRLDWEGFLEFL